MIRSRAQQLADEIGVDKIRLLPRAKDKHPIVPTIKHTRRQPAKPLEMMKTEIEKLSLDVSVMSQLAALRARKKQLDDELHDDPAFVETAIYRSLLVIAQDVAFQRKITLATLKGKSRIAEICQARFLYFSKARLAGHCLSDIGRFVNRDHGTVIHGLKHHPMSTLSGDMVLSAS